MWSFVLFANASAILNDDDVSNNAALYYKNMSELSVSYNIRGQSIFFINSLKVIASQCGGAFNAWLKEKNGGLLLLLL